MRNAAEASAREALRRELEREVATGGAAAVGEASRIIKLLPQPAKSGTARRRWIKAAAAAVLCTVSPSDVDVHVDALGEFGANSPRSAEVRVLVTPTAPNTPNARPASL